MISAGGGGGASRYDPDSPHYGDALPATAAQLRLRAWEDRYVEALWEARRRLTAHVDRRDPRAVERAQEEVQEAAAAAALAAVGPRPE